MLEELDSVLVYISLASVIKQVLHLCWGERRPQEAELVGRVSELYLYPIKSGGGVRVQKTFCSNRGLTNQGVLDR